MSFGSRLKERREALGITQPQLAELLGVSKGAVGNYETDLNSPRATILYKVFDILQCDANYLFQDEMKCLNETDAPTAEEFEKIIKKYRALDEHGKKIIDFVLEEEYERTQSQNLRTFQIAARDIGVQEMYVGSDMSNDLDQLPETDEDI